MTSPRLRFTQQPRETLTVDYRDVLEQAVANARYQALRDVRSAVEAIPTTQPTRRIDDWRRDPRSADDVKRDVLAELDRRLAVADV